MGVALGALNAATALLLRATITLPRTSDLIALAGIFFGTGAMVSCLLLWLLSERLGAILWLLAILFLLLAWRATQSNLFEFMAFRPDSEGLWGQLDLSPRGILLALALFLESGIYWTVGGWLAFYLGRKFGTASSTSLAILAGFWLALTCGRVGSQRLPPLEKRLRWLLASCSLCVVGSVFLIQTAEISGAVVGALCLGSGLGVVHPLTLGAVLTRHPQLQPRLLHTYFLVNCSAGLLVPWGVGLLAARMGIEIVVWTPLAAVILIFILLGIVVVESKLDSRAATNAG
jgi:fucose permease